MDVSFKFTLEICPSREYRCLFLILIERNLLMYVVLSRFLPFLLSFVLCFFFSLSLSLLACLLACCYRCHCHCSFFFCACFSYVTSQAFIRPMLGAHTRSLIPPRSVCHSGGDEGCRTGAAGAAIVEGEGGGIREMILQVSACLAGALVWMTGWLSGEISVEVCQRKGCLSPTEAIHCPLAGLIAALEACLLA